eukprot:TRINITY_DN20_c0_g1_i1.p1 TRINITY_DN20_c0_g1~~TRINITY_DN20_c0_g1_i1.p1  ORF type:complete len:508 (+),score=76.51 TRINITY_DN20_c0_g1_i1:81-1604(+)
MSGFLASVTALSSLELPLSFYSISCILVSFIVTYLALDQVLLRRKVKGINGPSWVWPILGSLFEMVFAPFDFWFNQDKYGPVSWNKVLNMVFIFCRDSQLSRQVLNNAGKDLQICINLNGERLLGANNIAFMQGAVHKELRRQLLPLFVRKALGIYIDIQEAAIRQHIKMWYKMGENDTVLEMRPLMRDLNMETSQHVFTGSYLPKDQEQIFRDDFNTVNSGMLCLPWNFPGTTLWKAIKARKRIVELLKGVATKSKARMAKDEEPDCLIDFWMQGTVQAIQNAKESGAPHPAHSDDYDIGCTVLDFLFAAQDASTSSLTWAAQLLCKHPDVLQKVREEQERLRPNDGPLTPEILASLVYTKQVVKEVLRFRTPATLIPHRALADFTLDHEGKKIHVPKGTMLIPSLYSSSYQGYSDPNTFDPDRFGPEKKEEVTCSTNWLVFGAGPHRCLGYDYAIFHLTAFVCLFATLVDFELQVTPTTEEIVYGPTIYPGDGCLLKLKPRNLIK